MVNKIVETFELSDIETKALVYFQNILFHKTLHCSSN